MVQCVYTEPNVISSLTMQVMHLRTANIARRNLSYKIRNLQKLPAFFTIYTDSQKPILKTNSNIHQLLIT